VSRGARLLLVVLAAAAAASAVPGLTQQAEAADECRGLLVCLPVPGPWVAIAAPSGQGAPSTEYVLQCPLPNYVVAGIDVRISDRAVDVSFRGETGAPVSPGTTTGRAIVFTGIYTGQARTPTSFQPFLGCVPLSGGGGQSQTGLQPASPDDRTLAAYRPTRPLTRAVANMRLAPGVRRTAVARCPRGGRLLRGTHAIAFRSAQEPSRSLLESVAVMRTTATGRVVATALLRRAAPAGVRVEVQVQAICTRGAG
jgi:hypothetical protein